MELGFITKDIPTSNTSMKALMPSLSPVRYLGGDGILIVEKDVGQAE